MSFARALVVLFLLAAPAAAQTAFESHIEGLRVLYATEVERANTAVSDASLANAALATAQQQVTALQGQVTTLQAQIVTLNAEIQRLNDLINNPPPPPPPPTGPDETIWPSSTTPAFPDYGDPGAYELGVKFKSSVAGSVKGIKFYKATANTGTHVGHLWASTGGNALATVTFSGETASGWQTATFSAPVSIVAGTRYIASVHMPAGHYSANINYFATARTSGSLTAVANSESPNGCYKSGTAGFPGTGSPNAANYWVDVVFSAGTVSNPPPSSPIVVAWVGPTLNTDGTPCTDLAGFKVAWGPAEGAYGTPLDVGNVLTATLPVPPPQWVVVRAYDTIRNESPWCPALFVQ